MDQFPSRERAATAVAEPRVSAIVVVRGVSASGEEQARLDVALRGVLSEPWVDEVVIVDNGNAPAVSSALRALQADRRDVMLVGAPIGAGNAVAANAGVAHAHGRWLLFLSSDVVMQRGAAQRMAAAGAQAPSPWVVGGRILDTSGRELPAHLDGALSPMSVVDVALKFGARRKARRRRATPTCA